MEYSINHYISESIKKNWEELAFTDFNGVTLQYRDVARKIAKLHILFEQCGIAKGDKIATCGKNSTQLSVTIIAALTYGAVPVPILHEFKPDNIHHLVNHSESKILFTDKSIWENLDFSSMPDLAGAVQVSDYSLLSSRSEQLVAARKTLNELFGRKYPERFTQDDVKYYEPGPEDLALINYTSGSTGFSKGVMLPHRALWSNVKFCIENLHILDAGDGIICMLPLAHMFGLVIEMLHPFALGCHMYFLTRVPSPKVIMDAFAQVKPKVIISVPLILEKIIKTKVFPLLEKPVMSMLLKVPFVDDYLLSKIKDKLEATFGGNLKQIIIGGAALNKEVADFLKRINFPVTVGYGMTECGPLISYAPWNVNPVGACGKIVERMEGKVVNTKENEHAAGELWVRGDNVMLGYYKNEDATAAVMKDGWLNTGDLCEIDEEGFLRLRGRSKTMILGPSGQNIYPEEIEQKINNLPYVCESLVVEEGGKLIALIYPDIENGAKQGMDFDALGKLMEENIAALNKDLPAYSRISGVKTQAEEFEKTPKRSIKRFLYQH
ncbi:MAG: AMP-binding protein [Muribaculaceae bacterium]|nr:AMP-binding protein [Muribaculaceae bacterium]MEE1297233.1 AMP-binding protein [Muribaculaceae bacterium]